MNFQSYSRVSKNNILFKSNNLINFKQIFRGKKIFFRKKLYKGGYLESKKQELSNKISALSNLKLLNDFLKIEL